MKKKHKNIWLVTHGMYGTSFYRRWISAKNRCTNPKNQGYKKYGGRGIRCLWNTFEEYKKDMYESYLDHVKKYGEYETTLDRINVNGNYSKKNCRWATHREQSRNTRTNRMLTFNNKTQCVVAWADELGVSRKAMDNRLNILGWTIEKALSTPQITHFTKKQ